MTDGTAPQPLPKPALKFPVVGLGASAGGLPALIRFFELMPSGSGMAFVVILHLSPKHESNLDQLLGNTTRMRVLQVTEAVAIEPDCVYVISPAMQLTMVDGMLEVAPAPDTRGRQTAIDLFFRTLAVAHKHHAMCVVLSGTGSDGAVGIKAIKEQGGVALAQEPADAAYDGMPRSAIATGVVDFVLPVEDMPSRILQIWENAKQITLPPVTEPAASVGELREANLTVRDILQVLRTRTGHDFSDYKRATVMRRIERRMQVTQTKELTEYLEYLRAHPAEPPALLRDLLISVTNFFRDREAFEALNQTVLPALLEARETRDRIRIWVPGCATGEEAYSIAMLVTEHLSQMVQPPELQIFATDIDADAIDAARAGFYPEGIEADVASARLQRFFAREANGYRIAKSIRESVMFAVHDVLRDPPFSRLDLISCRNLLIYLNRDVQGKVLKLFHFALQPEGFLFLGSSESVDEANLDYSNFDKPRRIYRPVPRPRTHAGYPVLGRGVSVSALGLGAAEPARAPSHADIHYALVEEWAPPSVVVNEQFEIVHLSEGAGRFLQFSGGEASLNLLKVVDADLRVELRNALYQVQQTGNPAQASVLRVTNGQTHTVQVTVRPARDPQSKRLFMLVLFDDQSPDNEGVPQATTRADTNLVERLEQELESVRDQLRTTIDQYETQTEELKASNEELQAINEELRSATEELETGKEELQSTNEELQTVNQELKVRVEETTTSNNDLRNFIASTSIGVVFVNRDLRVMRYTPPARDIFNLLESDVGRSLMDIRSKLEYPELEHDLRETVATLRAAEREIVSPQGRCYLVRTLPYRTSEDRIDGAVMTIVDITSRKQTESELRRSDERLRLLMDSLQDYALFTMGPDGTIDSWNAGAQRIFGWSAQEIVGQPAQLLFVPEDRETGVLQRELEVAKRDGRSSDERWHLRKDGSRFYCSGTVTIVHDGPYTGFVKIARDMTTEQLAATEREARLALERKLRQETEASSRVKDQFMATLSHELRNPLNLILMQSQLLLRSPELRKHAPLQRASEVIYQTVEAQARLIDDLLDVSRVVTGRMTLQQQLLPLPFIVADSVGAISQEAEARQITVDLDLTKEPLVVQADPVRVKQIAWNLLSNAVKFTPPGGRVSVRVRRDDGNACLDVVDTGEGISKDRLAGLFELFNLGDTRLARPHGGLGIGLALVKQLVELHGGRVEAHSAGEGKGSRFTVWLPLHVPGTTVERVTRIVAGAKKLLSADTAPATPEDARLNGIRVLVVDDSADFIAGVSELLNLHGASTTGAITAQEALKLARTSEYDVIVSDLAMPETDGLTLLRAIRDDSQNRDTPAIACTGFGRADDIARARAAGFSMHLVKPIEVETLVSAIRSLARPQERENKK